MLRSFTYEIEQALIRCRAACWNFNVVLYTRSGTYACVHNPLRALVESISSPAAALEGSDHQKSDMMATFYV